MPPTAKAALACTIFGGAALVSIFFFGGLLPLILYYAVLLVNTFFSIRTFAATTSAHVVQIMFDGTLSLAYIALAFSFGSILIFCALSSFLFVLAIGKYMHAQALANDPLIGKKIRINGIGALGSFGCLLIALAGYAAAATWILCIVFTLANVYLLLINPMYERH